MELCMTRRGMSCHKILHAECPTIHSSFPRPMVIGYRNWYALSNARGGVGTLAIIGTHRGRQSSRTLVGEWYEFRGYFVRRNVQVAGQNKCWAPLGVISYKDGSAIRVPEAWVVR